jgi:hypothetical protein
MQVECWADDEGTADLLARSAVAALTDLSADHPAGAVRGCEVTFGPLWSPDAETGRARYLFGLAFRMYAYTTETTD